MTKRMIFLTFILVSSLMTVQPVWAEQPDIAEGLYRNAVSLMDQGLSEQALADFWKIVRLYPGSEHTDDALYLIGKYHFDAGEYDESLEALNQVINTYGNLEWAPAAYYVKAQIFLDPKFEKFDYNGAFADFSRIFSIYKDSDWVDKGYFGAGLADLEMHDYSAARELFSRVTEEFPDSELSAEAQFYIGICFSMEGHIVWSLQAFQRVIDSYPSSPFAARARGINTLIYRTLFLPEQSQTYAYSKDTSFSLKDFNYDDLNALAIDDEGNIIASNAGEKALYWFSMNGKNLKKAKAKYEIGSLFISKEGDLISSELGRVFLGREGQKLFFPKKGGHEELDRIRKAVVDNEDNLYVLDSKYDGILMFPRLSKRIAKNWPPTMQLKYVEDIDIDREGSIFFINSSTNSLVKCKADGAELGRIPREGNEYKIKSMDDIAIDAIGNIYILDTKLDTIFLFSRELKFIQKIVLAKQPIAIDVNYRGEIFVINRKEKSIDKYK